MSVAPGTMVNRSGSVPWWPTTSSRKLGLPISTAPAWSRTVVMAALWVLQQVPTQWPSPPWIDTAVGTPVDRDACSTASPGG